MLDCFSVWYEKQDTLHLKAHCAGIVCCLEGMLLE